LQHRLIEFVDLNRDGDTPAGEHIRDPLDVVQIVGPRVAGCHGCPLAPVCGDQAC
jgi:hypothetical protein